MGIQFDESNVFSDSDIRALTKTGIELPGGRLIDHAACAESFCQVHGDSGKCVGERDVTVPSITYYTAPLPTRIVFPKKNRLLEFFDRDNAVSRFRTLCRFLEQEGYATRDVS